MIEHTPTGLPRKTREHNYHLIDSSVWNHFEFRPDDIVISSYSKAGSTWVQQIVGQLIWGGAEGYILSDVSPWFDCRFPSLEERLALVQAQTHRRFLKSHVPVDCLVFSPQAKYLYIGRDGRDILWSLYNHHRTMKPEVITGIDAVPERTGPPLGTAEDSVLDYFREWLARDGYPWWPFWEHVRSWWEVRHLPNVRLVHFANMKADMPGEIRKLATFLEIEIQPASWDRILEHCSFEYMKNHADQTAPFGGTLWEKGGADFMHQGVNNRWRDVLTPQDIKRYQALAREKLGMGCANWLATGMLPGDS